MSEAQSQTPAANQANGDRITLQPAPGLLVRKPDGAYLAALGEHVELDSYWRRRLADGDVVEQLQFAKPAKAGKATP